MCSGVVFLQTVICGVTVINLSVSTYLKIFKQAVVENIVSFFRYSNYKTSN